MGSRAIEGCVDSQSLALLWGPLDGWDFPLWPLGISAQSPAFQPAPAPFPLSLDSAGPQPCIPPTPPALGWAEVGITDQEFLLGETREQQFQDSMISSVLPSGPLGLAPPRHLAGSVGLGCGMSLRGVRGCGSSFPEASGCSPAPSASPGLPPGTDPERRSESRPR